MKDLRKINVPCTVTVEDSAIMVYPKDGKPMPGSILFAEEVDGAVLVHVEVEDGRVFILRITGEVDDAEEG